MKKAIFLSALSFALCAWPLAQAQAGTAQATMTNTVTVSNSCTLSTAGFTATYDPVQTNATTALTTTATVTSTCTLAALPVPVITLGQGANPGSGSTNAAPVRRLSSGGATPIYLNYGLYQDVTHLVTWGNTSATGVLTIGTGTAQTVTVYAQLPAGQTAAAPGTYTDQVVVTITF